MRRLAVSAVAASLLSSVAAPALAAGDCPDGDWFCEPAPSTPTPEPAPGAAPPSGGAASPPPAPGPYEPPPPAEERVRIDAPAVEPPRPRRARRGFREWGLNLHAVIGLMGNDDAMSPNADMNGLGGAVRFRIIPYIAIEGALELVWGTDYNGFDRFEHAELVNGLFYVNPRSAVQLYGLAGFGFGGAYLDSGTRADGRAVLADERYRYLGGQLGVGIEGRVTRHFALGGDLVGFLRSRVDRHADRQPEFTDPVSGRTTNTSSGGLLRLGATFYW